jgi:hypothetical protein
MFFEDILIDSWSPGLYFFFHHKTHRILQKEIVIEISHSFACQPFLGKSKAHEVSKNRKTFFSPLPLAKVFI